MKGTAVILMLIIANCLLFLEQSTFKKNMKL
jgi:hypothetical protein